MLSRRRTLAASLLLPLLAFGACADDDTSGGNDADGATGAGTEEATTTTAAEDGDGDEKAGTAGGKGTGTFTIAGTEFTFEAEPCSISGDDEQPEVEAQGKGTADGKPFTVVIKRSPSETSVVENFQLVFSNTEAMIGTNFVGLPDGAASSKVKVEDDDVTGSFEFLGTGGRPSGPGNFTLTCEK